MSKPVVTLLLAHPSAESLSAALARAARAALTDADADVRMHDLYADGFDPRMPASEVGTTELADELVARYVADVLATDAFVIVHPVWFFNVPAILKGWIDRVMREGIVYEHGPTGMVGLLKARSALLINTANGDEELERGFGGNALVNLWERVILGSSGVTDFRRLRFGGVARSSSEVRRAWLAEVDDAARSLVADVKSRLDIGHE